MSDEGTVYIGVIFDGEPQEQDVMRNTIAEAADFFVGLYGDDAVLEVRRSDYRSRED